MKKYYVSLMLLLMIIGCFYLNSIANSHAIVIQKPIESLPAPSKTELNLLNSIKIVKIQQKIIQLQNQIIDEKDR